MSDTATLFADSATDLQTIRGTLSRIMYSENGRLVGKIIVDASSRIGPDGKRRPSTMSVLGSMVEPKLHQVYEFTGIVSFNQQYCSHEIKFESYRTILPDDRDGIFSYLVDTAKWVGPSHAKALLDAFGTKTLEVLKHEADKVLALNLSGLTAERIREMAESLSKNEKLEAATLEVNNLLAGALGPATVRKAIKKWGCDAATKIKCNPYILMQLPGVGWHSADSVHRKLQGEPAAISRHAAALSHILSEAAGKEGHTILGIGRVQMEGQRLVGGLRDEVWQLCEQDESVESDGITVSLGSLIKSEKYVANKIISMLAQPKVERLFPKIDTEGLAEDQAAAVAALDAQVSCLVGAPGTGKTYTIARTVKALVSAGLTVDLAAPTGKAAKQMSLALSEVCPQPASTIHSLLEPTIDEDTGEFYFGRDESNPLECDVLVVDELSMVDIRLACSLLKAVRETTRVIFVGDHYQLPSVGPGALLRDLLRAGVPSFELKQIKRNAGDIVRACHAIKDGKSPKQFASNKLDLEAGHNWRHIQVAGPEAIKTVVAKLIRESLPAFKYDMFWEVQAISPTNEKGELSCTSLNSIAREILNPAARQFGKLPFSVGDKVVRCKNANVKGDPIRRGAEEGAEPAGVQPGQVRIVNGDIGIIREIDEREIIVEFRYPDRRATVKRAEHELKLAYCMTCHKLQGSECQVVILPLHPSLAKMPMVTREWIYTAISRAKTILITVGDLDAIDFMVPKVGMNQRQTMLARIVEQGIKGTREVRSCGQSSSLPPSLPEHSEPWADL